MINLTVILDPAYVASFPKYLMVRKAARMMEIKTRKRNRDRWP